MTDIPYSQIQAAPVQQQVNQSLNHAATRANQLGIELGPELRAELAAPTTYYPGEEQNANPGFYENTTWAYIQPQQRQAKPVDTRPQPEIAYENYLAEKPQAEQPQEQAEQIQGANAKLVAASLEYGWETPSFQAYLDSDDDAYMSVRLSPQQLQLAQEVWGLDEGTAKAYIYHHKLDANDLALIEQSFLGTNPRIAPSHQQDADDSSYASDSTVGGNSDSAGDYDSVAALNDVDRIRYTYFPKVDNAEWSKILNGVIDEFETLSPEEHEKYTDPIAGFWAMHLRVNSRQQQQVQQQRDSLQASQQIQREKPKTHYERKPRLGNNIVLGNLPNQPGNANPKSLANTNTAGAHPALTPQGKLKQSFIDKLSPQQYERDADRIYRWYAAGKVDRNA